MEFKISSVWFLLISFETDGSFPPFGGAGIGLVFPSMGCVEAFNGRDYNVTKRKKIRDLRLINLYES